MTISLCYWHLLVKNGNWTLVLTSSGQQYNFSLLQTSRQSRMAISHWYWHLVVRNGNFTLVLTSSGQEWQFHIVTDILVVKIGTYTLVTDILQWSEMAISHCNWHLLVKNGKWTLVLTSSGQQYNFSLLQTSSSQEMAISHWYWHLVVRNGNFTLLLTSSGQEWQFHIATDI